MPPKDHDHVASQLLLDVELADADRARLADLHARLAPQLPEIVQRLVDRLVARSHAGALLTSPEQTARLRDTLVEWMASGLVGRHDEGFRDGRSRAGSWYVAAGLPRRYVVTAVNLVRNALEAVAPGGHVTVTIDGNDDHVHLTIEDDGPGIPEAVQRRIYEPFFTTKEAGTGLGLSIVHGMVVAHGGTITVASSPRRTRFDVSLPRRP